MDTEQNNGFGPISEKRGRRAKACAAVLLFLSMLVVLKYKADNYVFIAQLFFCIVAAISGEVIKNSCQVVEELCHLKERHNGSIKKAIDVCFSHPDWRRFLIALSACSLIILCICNETNSSFDTHYLKYALLQLCLASLVSYLLDLKRATQAEISEMNENGTNNVANGLALHFYYEYLKPILLGIKEVIKLSDNEIDGFAARDLIEDHKIFIVIPKDCNCESNFEEVDPNIKCVSKTHERVISLAGNLERVYKNSIYKVISGHGTFYCLMEYATPLLTMFQMQKDLGCHFRKEDMDQQVVLFYRRLKEILDNDEDCQGRYHLVLISNARTDLADVMGKEILKSRDEVMRNF